MDAETIGEGLDSTKSPARTTVALICGVGMDSESENGMGKKAKLWIFFKDSPRILPMEEHWDQAVLASNLSGSCTVFGCFTTGVCFSSLCGVGFTPRRPLNSATYQSKFKTNEMEKVKFVKSSIKKANSWRNSLWSLRSDYPWKLSIPHSRCRLFA